MTPPGQLLLQATLAAIPELVALIVALIFMANPNRRGPAVCFAIAMGILVVSQFGWPFYYNWLWEHRVIMDLPRDQETFFVYLGRGGQLIIRLGTLALLLVAAFRWRSSGAGVQASAVGHAAGAGVGAVVAGSVRPLSKSFYLSMIVGSFVLAVLLLIPGLILIYGDRGRNAMAGLPFACGAEVLAIFGSVMVAILIYKIWAAIQGEPTTRTTPGKAVGFLFIPLFNFYWVFQAYWGWTKDYNQFIEARGIDGPRASPGLAMTLCVLIFFGFIPGVNILVSLINLVLVAMYLNTAIDGVNAIAAAGPSPTLLPEKEGPGEGGAHGIP